MDRHIDLAQELGDSIDLVAHHRTADVIGMVMGGQNTGDLHAVGFNDFQKFINCVCGIDDDAFARVSVAQQIDEVHHLGCEAIAHCEVPSGEQLPKVEAVIGHTDRLWRTLRRVMEDLRILVGDRLVPLPEESIRELNRGGRLVPLPSEGVVLCIPVEVRRIVEDSIARAVSSFTELQNVPSERIDSFFENFAELIDNDNSFGPVLAANRRDVSSAAARGRATGRLEITSKMRRDMADGLRMWARLSLQRLERTDVVVHDGWHVESWRAPLGVVGFVFEGRPNVFADAMGVLKSGNTVVFRIGSDALETARAIRDHAMNPAIRAAGLPDNVVSLVDSADRAAGWALFGDRRLSLAVARGSGEAVAQLGAVARQNGVPVSLHGTGGAWIITGSRVDGSRLEKAILHSLDRKVCNTLNTLVITEADGSESLQALREAVLALSRPIKIHTEDKDVIGAVADVPNVSVIRDSFDPGTEWEWDDVPEFGVVRSPDVGSAVTLFNGASPQFVLSVVSEDPNEVESAWRSANAPFFGDGFTRWVDGQFALNRPELGLANWQSGRLLGRGGVLSGDGVHTLRLRMSQFDTNLHR